MRIVFVHTTLLIVLSCLHTAHGNPKWSIQQWVDGLKLPHFNWVENLTSQPSSDFWRSAKELGDAAVRYTDKTLQEATVTYHESAQKINEFKDSMLHVVAEARLLHEEIKTSAEKHGLNLNDISDMISSELAVVIEELKAEFTEPLPEEASERNIWGMKETQAREKFDRIRPKMNTVLLITGNVIDNHPILLETLLFAGAILLLPESWLLRLFFNVFGFGPLGPVKGYPAAWVQSRFWGAAVKTGSWFSKLQSAGMKSRSGLGRK